METFFPSCLLYLVSPRFVDLSNYPNGMRNVSNSFLTLSYIRYVVPRCDALVTIRKQYGSLVEASMTSLKLSMILLRDISIADKICRSAAREQFFGLPPVATVRTVITTIRTFLHLHRISIVPLHSLGAYVHRWEYIPPWMIVNNSNGAGHQFYLV